MINQGGFDHDRWQLFHTDVDRSEAHDLAAEYPEKVEELTDLWLAEARRINVLPLNDYGVEGIHALEYKVTPRWTDATPTTHTPAKCRRLQPPARSGRRSRSSPRPEFTAASQGVIVSQGSRFGGYTMFVKDRRLSFVYNFLGIPPEQELSTVLPAPGKHVVGVAFMKVSISDTHEVLGTMALYVDGNQVAAADFRTQSGHYALCGEGLAVGRDSGDPVSREYGSGFAFSAGQIVKVTYDVGDDTYVDLERRLGAILARD